MATIKNMLIMLILLLPGALWAGNKIDPVAQEYINQIITLSTRIALNDKAIQTDFNNSDMRSANRDIEEMSRLDKEFKALKLDVLKYYKGKFPKAFAVEWKKYEDKINVARKKKPRGEELPPTKPMI